MLTNKQVALTSIHCVCTALLLVSCASRNLQVPRLDTQTQTADSVVCDHQFTTEQLALSPSYTENEFNVVINGNSETELVQALDTELPFGGHGRTKWKVNWQFDLKPNLGGCRVADVRSNVEVVYQLPLWPDQILDASVEIKKQLAALQSSATCGQAEASANALVRSIIDNHKQAEARLIPPAVSDYLIQ